MGRFYSSGDIFGGVGWAACPWGVGSGVYPLDLGWYSSGSNLPRTSNRSPFLDWTQVFPTKESK